MTSIEQIDSFLETAFKDEIAVTVIKVDNQEYSGYILNDFDYSGFSLSSGIYCFLTDIIEVRYCLDTLAIVDCSKIPITDPFV